MKKLWFWLLAFVILFFVFGFFHRPIERDGGKILSQKNVAVPVGGAQKQSLDKGVGPSFDKINLSNIPKIVHYNFIELDKISKISKFRSGYGHDFSRGFNETNSCRSMKHYFMIKGIDDAFWSRYHEGKVTKAEWPTVKYFAPVSGVIVDMRSSENMFGEKENQFILESDKYPNIWFGFFHVLVQKNISRGSKVHGGEFLGTISPGNDGEIAVTINPNSDNQLVSFFKLLDANVFSKYQKRGIDSREEFIISAKERDENPLICENNWEERFVGSKKIPNDKSAYDSWSMGGDNWVLLK